MFGFALYFSMSELLEVVYVGIEDHMANPLSDFWRNIFFLTNACKLQCFVQFGAELNWTSTYVFRQFCLRVRIILCCIYRYLLSLTRAMRGRFIKA